MRIERRAKNNERANRVREDVGHILRGGVSGKPVCAPDCPVAIRARCSRDCPDIPRMMSSEPDEFPLEGHIAPLAFELKKLEVFHPCWSCEGHNGVDGKLWKIPQVWFYCDSVVHLRVLADAVTKLHSAKNLTAPWRVALTFSDSDNADSTFSLEPALDASRPLLTDLWRDVDVIAEYLRDIVFGEALKLSRLAR